MVNERGRELSVGALAAYFLRLGTLGFGGPVVLVETMRRDLHEIRGWFTEAEYNEGLAFAQLAPGPLAAQLAIYLGWLRAGVRGATAAGIAFVAPSFLMVLLLSAVYVRYDGLTWMQGAFYGIGSAVIAVIAVSAWRLVRKTVRRDWLLWTIVSVNAAVVAYTERELVWLFAASGLLVLLLRAMPKLSPTAVSAIAPWALTGLHGEAPAPLLATLVLFFAKAGAVVFGSGLAIVPFLHGMTVLEYHWLTERQFLDAVAVSMITPGPVVITVAFIGYLMAGPLGAAAAAIGVFLPVYFITVLLAPLFRRGGANPQLRAAVAGVTAAASGAIAGAALVLGRRAIVDLPTALMFVGALVIVLRFKKAPIPIVVGAAGVLGILLTATNG